MKSSDFCAVAVSDTIVTVKKGTPLAVALGEETPCGGKGLCGKCRVRVLGDVSAPGETERRLLGADELANGIRLACCTEVLGDCRVERLSQSADIRVLTDGESGMYTLRPVFSKYGVAVDIGTTTIAAKLYSPLGELLAEESALNPQTAFGADVVTRIQASVDGKSNELARCVKDGLEGIISSLGKKAGILTKEIDGVVIVGNTVMLHLLTEECVKPLARAPFEAKRLFDEELTARGLGLSSLCGECKIYLPPCISAFVGADTTAAIVATGLCREGGAEMLVDIGTNGEIALWKDGKLTVCSTAAGPALEGVGISCGMRGGSGAIDSVVLAGNKLISHTIGGVTPVGLCGSGLVDAIACLLMRGDIDETGYMDGSVKLAGDVTLEPGDVRRFQLAKGAIIAGIKTALASVGASFEELGALYIAGGFGSRLNIKNAVLAGLIPKEVQSKVKIVGNAALSGAATFLLDGDSGERCRAGLSGARVLSLATDPVFAEEYIRGMMFD